MRPWRGLNSGARSHLRRVEDHDPELRDAHGFWDRSLGTVTNGTASSGPNQLRSATNEVTGSSRSGRLSAQYNAAGYPTSMAVRRNATTSCPTMPCGMRFVYQWDEAGRLASARRWNLDNPGQASDPISGGTPAATMRYLYNGGDQRTLKTSVDDGGNERHTVYALGSLELRRTVFENGDYRRDAASETPYLLARGVRLGRVAYAPGTPELGTDAVSGQRVFLELGDHLGSTSTLVDLDTSEVVEKATYQVYGAAESVNPRPRASWRQRRMDA